MFASGIDYSEVIWELEWEIKKAMEKENICGLSIALVEGEQLVWAEGFGYTDRTKKEKVTPETLFSTQSMGKSFTATAFLILASKGLVSLDDPIRKYYPEFTVNTKFANQDAEIEKITFRRMLSHWASFTHEAIVGNNFDDTPCSFEAHIQSIANSWLRSPVGSEATYSNLGYDLTGYVMGKILNKSYEEVMREELLHPLEITTATFNINEALKHPFAKGHSGEFATPTVQVPMLPAGGLYISAIDIAKYISFHLRKGKINDRQIIDSKLWTEMYQPQFLDSKEFGYGLGVYSVKKQKAAIVYGHGGGGYGYLTEAKWIPDYNVGVVVLTNDMKHGKQTILADKALELMVNEKEKPKVKKVEPELLQRLEGTYCTMRTLFQRIAYEGDKLYSYAVNGTRLELFPQSPTEFATIDGGKYLFKLNEDGFPLSFYREQPGALWPYRAKYNDGPNDKPGPNKTEWQDYLGIYQFQSYGRTGHLVLSIKTGYLYLTSGDELKLHHYKDNIYFTADGEALVLGKDSLTYRNIPTKKIDLNVDQIIEDSKKSSIDGSKVTINGLIAVINAVDGFDQTLAFIEKSIEIDNEFKDNYLSFGNRLFALGKLEKATKCYEKLLEIDPDNEKAKDMLEKTTRRLPPQ